MPPNPLASPSNDHPAMLHAKMWQHAHSLSPDDLPEKIKRLDYVLPVLGALANNPKVTAKDVIKAAASAAADGAIEPSQAVKFITGMPAESEKLRPWLKTLYEANLSAAVHMKAAAMKPATQPAQAPQQGVPPQSPGGVLG